ncbi:MAG: AMP-binding protein [Gemmatimonadales bacterium]
MILRSRFPSVQIPDCPLGDYVFAHAAEWADRPALIDGPSGRTLTYGALGEMIARCKSALVARGFAHGDVLCLFSPNVPEYAAVFFAVAELGGANTTANPMYGAEELARQLADSGAKIVVTAPALAEKARAAAAAAGIREVVVWGEAPGCTPFAEFLERAPATASASTGAAHAVHPARDVVALPYSSGTTGLPKGVMLSHRNLVANLAQIDFVDGTEVGDHLVGVLPFYHIYGMLVVLCGVLRKGGCVVTMPHFDLEQYLRLSATYRVKRAYLVPPIALALARHPMVGQFDLSSLKFVTSGAAPMGAELEASCAARIGCMVKQGYGMTEASPVTHFAPEDPAFARGGSCGLLVPNTECRIVDLITRKDADPGEHGELLIRGPQVMLGYLNNPEASAQAVDGDGWLHTGDVGYADADGFFYIVDRLKEFIKYKGYQVAPAELEGILLAHAAVADCAVIPMADADAGEIPKAFIVMRHDVTSEELMEYVAGVVASFKKVRSVEFIEKIPKSPSGKILRRELIALERSRIVRS